MECTQRLECSQDAYDNCSERTCPEQIGFLGICGSKQPIKKGPNKIGRDPQTCNIVLNDNSISRQHAVINILNSRDFMLMDLDSSNKTKLLDKTLQPYIPHPLKNGDTVQFGQVFGIFRLFEEDDDLPMTQAIEIPDTPINTWHVSRLKNAPITTVPESPDVSDRDDSIIAPSQSKKKTDFISQNNNFIKSSGKIVGIQQIGTNKIDNVYWNSSKKSDSFSSSFESNPINTVNKSNTSAKKFTIESSIYDMETQAPALLDIYQSSDSIYEANTQVPCNLGSQTIYSCETQVPNIEKLPEVFKVRDQSNVQLNLYSTTEKLNLFEAKTQIKVQDKGKKMPTLSSAVVTSERDTGMKKKLNSSDEEICFDEIDCQQFGDECGSQPLLPPDPCHLKNLVIPIINSKSNNFERNEISNGAVLIESNSKDCKKIVPSQVVPEKPSDDDVTDCEDNMIELVASIANHSNKIKSDDDVTDYEDELNKSKVNGEQKTINDDDLADCDHDVIEISQNIPKASNLFQSVAELPTQVIGEKNLGKEKNLECGKQDVPFEDMLTQVIEECPIQSNVIAFVANNDKTVPFEDLQTQLIDIVMPQEQLSSTPKQTENNTSFKRPHSSPRHKKKDATLNNSKSTVVIKEPCLQSKVEDEQNYYDATQQILNDLCTQNEQLDNLPSSNIERNATEKINNFGSNSSIKQVQAVVGTDGYIAPLSKKKSSDTSDLEVTPKKFNLSKFLMIDLPNSQEIKSCDFVSSAIQSTDSSDSFEDTKEQENNRHSPIIGSHRRKRKKNIKVDLTKKFDINTLPTRVTNRIRKPTSKILESEITEKILQSKLGLDKEHEVGGEVIDLNLKGLRNKMEKEEDRTTNNNNNSRNKKSDKTEKDVLLKHVQIEQKVRKNDEKPFKEHLLPHRNAKELKQQNIKSMFKEPSSKAVNVVEEYRNVKTESINSSDKSRRSSRIKRKGDKKDVTKPEVMEVNSESCENKKSSNRTHISCKQIKESIDLTKDQETVVRRSRRHQYNNDKIKDKKEKLRTLISENIKMNTPNNEHSAVYNLSSETAVDSSTNLKRQATSDIYPSKIKKAKSSTAVNASVRAIPLRGIKTQYVLFTAFPCEEVKLKMEKLGAIIVSDVKSCTVVLTVQLKRTFKLLCALGLGKPIVGPNWVQACADSNMIVDPWLYLMKDEATEKRFGFNLRQSLTRNRNFLKGYNVFCTPKVVPNAKEMKCKVKGRVSWTDYGQVKDSRSIILAIVECSGGTWKDGGRSWFCVTCNADKALWSALRKRGATLVSTEFILGGVLQQRLNIDRDKLG